MLPSVFPAVVHAQCAIDELPALDSFADGLTEAQARRAQQPLARYALWLERCESTAARVAIAELRRMAGTRPRVERYDLLYAVSLARSPEIHPREAKGLLYRGAYQNSNTERDATRLLARLAGDMRRFDVVNELAALALATRNRATLRDAIRVFEALERDLAALPPFWAMRAELALATTDYDRATLYGERARDMGSPAGSRTAGVARILLGDTLVGTRLYLDGLAAADDYAVRRYYDDLALLVTAAEQAEWNGLDPEARRGWILRRWTLRAASAAIPVEARIVEHHRRIARAWDEFRRLVEVANLPALHTHGPFDDRGIIYVRHGEPDDVITGTRSRTGISRTAWVYHGIAGGPAVFEFSKRPEWSGHVMGEPLACEPWLYVYIAPSGGAAMGRYFRFAPDSLSRAIWQSDMMEDFIGYASRIGRHDPAIAARASSCFHGAASVMEKEDRAAAHADAAPRNALARIETRRTLRVAMQTESAGRLLPLRRRPVTSIYALESAGSAEVVAVVGIPGDALTAQARASGVRYSVAATFSVEYASGQVARRDTVVELHVPDRLQRDALVRIVLSLPSVAADTGVTARVTVRDGGTTGAGEMMVSLMDLRASKRGEFGMSDIVIADGQTGTWTRGEASLGPVPGHNIAGGSFQLFYELYQTRPDDTLHTTVVMAPGSLDRDLLQRLQQWVRRRQAMTVAFEESAAPGVDGVLRVVRDLRADLEPGVYELTVEVRNARTGESVTRSATVRVH